MDSFEEVGILREFIGILDNVDSALVTAERYRLSSALIRTFVYDQQGTIQVHEAGQGV
jgi:hypothetical protein